MSKKPAGLLSSTLPALSAGCQTPRTSSSCLHRRPPPHSYHRHPYPSPHPNAALPARNYAQHAGRASQTKDPALSWPEAVRPHKTPTPYQILATQKDEPYSKQRFYLLVKLYHPDQCHPSSPVFQLPQDVRLERYRLLIAAHTLLSDPAKRSAYDLWGHGWAGQHQTPTQQQAAWESGAYRQKSWPPGHDPHYNATWEDWERWHQREQGQSDGQQDSQPVYMSNFGFLSAVFALVSIGSVVQGTRANMFSSSVMEHRDKMHKEASLELGRSKRATIASDRDGRIETFLRHREAVHAGQDAYQRLLPDPENCSTDSLRKQ